MGRLCDLRGRCPVTPGGLLPIVGMDATAVRSWENAGASKRVAGSPRLFGWAIVGCAACCLGPLLATTSIGTLLAAATAPSGAWALAALAVGGFALAIVLSKGRPRNRSGTGKGELMNEPIVCRLPVSDRARRTTDFRALFADTLVDRTGVPDGVRWTQRALPTTESESRRLAALETRCCDGIRFDIVRAGDHVVWQITGPESARTTLDALYDLPMLVRHDARANELWTALDTAVCGPKGQS